LDAELAAEYSPEQRHGLTVRDIFQPHVRFFVAYADDVPAGCGGVALFADFAELKRMYVRPAARGRGVADALVGRLIEETQAVGLRILRLETGTRQRAAMRFYARHGFERCEVFGPYASLPRPAIRESFFMEKRLSGA